MEQRNCLVEDCKKPHLARGWCGMHYQRWRKQGGTEASRQPAVCSVQGCTRNHHGHGYCSTHLRRLVQTGTTDPTPRIRQTCVFEGCGRPAVGQRHCTGHYQQSRQGKALKPLRPTWKSTIRDEHGRKRCRMCELWASPTDFYPKKPNADGLSEICKRCDRDRRIRRNYGITVAQYEEILRAQGGGCAICGGQPKDGPSLHVDHDHACCPGRKKSCGQCIRGLLCEDCNRVLGMFSDHIPRFKAAIAYLKSGTRG